MARNKLTTSATGTIF